MQVIETKNEGLSRAYAITVPAADIQQRVESRLQELVGQVRIPGFRPGKVPVKLIRQRYGDAVKGEVLQETVAENASKALADRGLGGVSYGSGARDTTRLAASGPELWADILLANQPSLDEALERTGAALAELRALLATGDAAALRRYLETARDFRRGLDR